jgi:hypothetical protein
MAFGFPPLQPVDRRGQWMDGLLGATSELTNARITGMHMAQ